MASLLLSDSYGTQHEGLEEYADRKNRIKEIEDRRETPTDEERELKVIKYPEQIAQDKKLEENMQRFTNEYFINHDAKKVSEEELEDLQKQAREDLEKYLFGILKSKDKDRDVYDRINVLERALKLAVNRRPKESRPSKAIDLNSRDIKGHFSIEPKTTRGNQSDESSLGTPTPMRTPTPQLVRDITSQSPRGQHDS